MKAEVCLQQLLWKSGDVMEETVNGYLVVEVEDGRKLTISKEEMEEVYNYLTNPLNAGVSDEEVAKKFPKGEFIVPIIRNVEAKMADTE